MFQLQKSRILVISQFLSKGRNINYNFSSKFNFFQIILLLKEVSLFLKKNFQLWSICILLLTLLSCHLGYKLSSGSTSNNGRLSQVSKMAVVHYTAASFTRFRSPIKRTFANASRWLILIRAVVVNRVWYRIYPITKVIYDSREEKVRGKNWNKNLMGNQIGNVAFLRSKNSWRWILKRWLFD